MQQTLGRILPIDLLTFLSVAFAKQLRVINLLCKHKLLMLIC